MASGAWLDDALRGWRRCPINWWLVVKNMKHGMLTVRPEAGDGADHDAHEAPAGNDNVEHVGSTDKGAGGHDEHSGGEQPEPRTIMLVMLITFATLIAGLWLAGGFFG